MAKTSSTKLSFAQVRQHPPRRRISLILVGFFLQRFLALILQKFQQLREEARGYWRLAL